MTNQRSVTAQQVGSGVYERPGGALGVLWDSDATTCTTMLTKNRQQYAESCRCEGDEPLAGVWLSTPLGRCGDHRDVDFLNEWNADYRPGNCDLDWLKVQS